MRTTTFGTGLLTVFGALILLTGLGAPATAGSRTPALLPSADITLSGRVIDAAAGTPVPSAQVFVPELNTGVLSQQNGSYAMTLPRASLPTGTVHLVVQRLGYREASVELDVAVDLAGPTYVRDFQLEQAALQLDEAIVTGTPGANQARAAGDALGNAIVTLNAAAGPAPMPTALPPGWNREQYDRIVENAYQTALDHPLSTFSIDVDRASYSNVRRFLGDGQLPPIDAVRIEEMVNYFDYDYALPEGDEPLAVTTELGEAAWHEGHLLLRIGLASPAIDTAALPPSNLVFLLDVSGSMESPDKLPLVKRSMRLLVNQLRGEDRVAIVVYAGAAGLVLESTPGSERERILDAIERLEAGGSTAGGAGLRLAYRVAEENFLDEGNNRVILATDGDFNVGESSDSEMVRLIEQMREKGTFLTVLGFGTGNLQSEKMEALAQNGNGNYGYVDSLDEARKILVNEMGATLVTVAQDVKLQVEFNPTQVAAYRLIGYENRLLAAEDFNNDAKDAGDLGAGHRVTALYEIIPVGADTDVTIPGVDPLRYQRPPNPSGAATDELAFVRIRYKPPRGSASSLIEAPVSIEIGEASEDFSFASAVAGFGMILRNSEYRGSMDTDRVLGLAREGLGLDPEGYRQGFIDMVRAYRRITDAGER